MSKFDPNEKEEVKEVDVVEAVEATEETSSEEVATDEEPVAE